MDLTEMRCEVMYWIELAQGTFQLRGFDEHGNESDRHIKVGRIS
jgi:hypothetical protein